MVSPQVENGHIDLANEIVEALAKTYLSSYETQVLFAIFRKTYGWHKKMDWITGSQLVKMTAISKSHISETLKRLIHRNLIIKNGSKLGFQKDFEKWEKFPKQGTSKKFPIQDKKFPKQGTAVPQTGNKKFPKRGNTKETKRNYTKETIQRVQNQPLKSLNKEKKPANEIEFDFELWSWHGIDEDIKDRWAKIFPNIEVEIELNKIREYFKKHPGHEKIIEKKFHNNYSIYIFDWLARAEKYIKEGDKNK